MSDNGKIWLFSKVPEHDHFSGVSVRCSSKFSRPFHITNYMKKVLVLAATHFTLYFSMVLKQGMKDLNDGNVVNIGDRLEGSLFNLWQLLANTETQEQLIQDVLFYINAFGTTNNCRRVQKSVCVAPSTLPPSSLTQSHESLIGPCYDSSNSSTSAALASSLTATTVTLLSILKSLKKRISPASKPCYWSPNYNRQDTYLEWEIITFSGSYCAVSFSLVIAIEGQQRSDSKIAWDNVCHID